MHKTQILTDIISFTILTEKFQAKVILKMDYHTVYGSHTMIKEF